ncbi:MAG: 1-phosphofructokinase family hexose kinase [Phenylobacterium sp.]
MVQDSPGTGIATLTLNPALDLQTAVDRVEPENKLRCDAPRQDAGGGGVNVSRVIRRLGGRAPCLLPLGGPAGRALEARLAAEGLEARVIPIAGETRQSFTVFDRSRRAEFRFVLPGPRLSAREIEALEQALGDLHPQPGVLVLSGSLPPGFPPARLTRLAARLRRRGIRLALDASGEGLKAGLAAGVWLVKPNRKELGDCLGQDLADRPRQLEAARSLVAAGRARWVALSLGQDGALLVGEGFAGYAPALPITPVSTVGAGDSFLAGLSWELCRGASPEAALVTAVAAASATLLSPGSGMARRADIRRLRPQVRVEVLEGATAR